MNEQSIFAAEAQKLWKHRFHATISVERLVAGIPADEKVATSWIKTKIGDNDDLTRKMVAETMAELGISAEEAAELVGSKKGLKVFKEDDAGLYIERRNVLACLREAVNVAVAADHLSARGWGKTNKGAKGFFVEHIHIPQSRIHLGRSAPDGIDQKFVHTFRGTGIEYESYVNDAKLDFDIHTDHDFGDKFWQTVWITAERCGIGASRSQGNGRFAVVDWSKE